MSLQQYSYAHFVDANPEMLHSHSDVLYCFTALFTWDGCFDQITFHKKKGKYNRTLWQVARDHPKA